MRTESYKKLLNTQRVRSRSSLDCLTQAKVNYHFDGRGLVVTWSHVTSDSEHAEC